MLATATTNIDRALQTQEECSAYERDHPGSSSNYRRPGGPPAAVAAIAARHGVSQELVRKLRNIARSIAPELLERLRPYEPGLRPLLALACCGASHQAAVVDHVTKRGVTLVEALRALEGFGAGLRTGILRGRAAASPSGS